jgi:hypothetical protein
MYRMVDIYSILKIILEYKSINNMYFTPWVFLSNKLQKIHDIKKILSLPNPGGINPGILSI